MTEPNILHNDPKVFTIDDFLTNEEKVHFLKLGLPQLQDSVVSGGKGGVSSSGRTSETSWIPHKTSDITLRVAQRISDLVEIPLENAESFQFVSYEENGEYRPHYDSWNHDGSEKALRNVKFGGPRVITSLIYLNTVQEGGDTRFTKLDINVKAESGKLLVFENTHEDGYTKHLQSEHAGTPVVKGKKYILNLWFRHKDKSRLYSETNPAYYEKLESK